MKRVQKHRTFFGLTRLPGRKMTMIVVGVPWDRTSSYRRGSAAAPKAIRSATDAELYNYYTQGGKDLAATWKVCDHGDIKRPTNIADLENNIRTAIEIHDHSHEKTRSLFLGGDHFVTYPAFVTVSKLIGRPMSLVYFDAHPDLYTTYNDSLYSHATVVSRILESETASTGKVCYVGIRASTKEQDNRIKDLELVKHTAADVCVSDPDRISRSIENAVRGTPIYVSIDVDCLDPAYAPGVGNPEAGGLSTRRLFDILQNLRGLEIMAADIVEYSPSCDSSARTTAFVLAVLVKEIMGAMTGLSSRE